ncbi:MAG: hypothetical protein GX303_08490 [Clostridiales bacterium]|nr:hypothetical protein [Clostridiales bacterium]
MQIFHRRPLAFALFLFLLTAVLGYYLPGEFKIWGIVLSIFVFLTSFALLIWKYRRFAIKGAQRTLFFLLSSLFAAIALLSSYQYFDRYYASYVNLDGVTAEIEATVTRVAYISDYACYYDINVHKINGKRANAKMKLETDYPCTLYENDLFTMPVTFRDMAEDINGYAEKKIAQSKGFTITAFSDAPDYEIIGKGKFTATRFFSEYE